MLGQRLWFFFYFYFLNEKIIDALIICNHTDTLQHILLNQELRDHRQILDSDRIFLIENV
jgi:hypothetical protein